MNQIPKDGYMRPLGDPVRHYWLAKSMAKATGVDLVAAMDEGRLSQRDWADTVERCRGCGWTDGCDQWLDGQVCGRAEVPKACMNAELFERLKP